MIAHGSIADTVKESVNILRKRGKNIGLFRPITLNPFDTNNLLKVVKNVKKIYVIESSLNQLSRIVKYEIPLSSYRFNYQEISKPAESFSVEEIINKITRI